jgi:hypothetical protein
MNAFEIFRGVATIHPNFFKHMNKSFFRRGNNGNTVLQIDLVIGRKQATPYWKQE